jgi:hypothetical protein
MHSQQPRASSKCIDLMWDVNVSLRQKSSADSQEFGLGTTYLKHDDPAWFTYGKEPGENAQVNCDAGAKPASL